VLLNTYTSQQAGTVTCALESFVFGTRCNYLFYIGVRPVAAIQYHQNKPHITKGTLKNLKKIISCLFWGTCRPSLSKSGFPVCFQSSQYALQPYNTEWNHRIGNKQTNKQYISTVPYFHEMSYCPWCFCRSVSLALGTLRQDTKHYPVPLLCSRVACSIQALWRLWIGADCTHGRKRILSFVSDGSISKL
jgi:hypothetical protein